MSRLSIALYFLACHCCKTTFLFAPLSLSLSVSLLGYYTQHSRDSSHAKVCLIIIITYSKNSNSNCNSNCSINNVLALLLPLVIFFPPVLIFLLFFFLHLRRHYKNFLCNLASSLSLSLWVSVCVFH